MENHKTIWNREEGDCRLPDPYSKLFCQSCCRFYYVAWLKKPDDADCTYQTNGRGCDIKLHPKNYPNLVGERNNPEGDCGGYECWMATHEPGRLNELRAIAVRQGLLPQKVADKFKYK